VTLALYAVSVVVPGLYAETLGASVVGAVVLATRLIDVGFDVGVGFLSDNTPPRFGRRRAWIAAGAVVIGIGYSWLAAPSAPGGQVHLFLSLLLFSLGWSMLVVPHNSWGSELASGYHERSALFAFRAAASYLGSIAFALIPVLPIFPRHEYDLEVIRFSSIA